MSFILDALKKSESERQRQAMPGLVQSDAARPRRRLPVWAMALGILLAVNLIVLVIVLARSWFAPAHTPAVPAETMRAATPGAVAPVVATPAAAQLATAPASNDHFSPMDAPPEYAPELPVANPTAGAPSGPAPADKPTTSAPAGQRPAHRYEPVLADDYKAEDSEVLPTVNELSLTGAQALPELHLDVHVFATRPAERFVYVNMRKYHEGATLQEGPTVEHIRRDGVILSYGGLRFLLPRQ